MSSSKAEVKRYVLSLSFKLFIVGVWRSSSSSEFQTAGPSHEKTHSPLVERSLLYQLDTIQDVTSKQLLLLLQPPLPQLRNLVSVCLTRMTVILRSFSRKWRSFRLSGCRFSVLRRPWICDSITNLIPATILHISTRRHRSIEVDSWLSSVFTSTWQTSSVNYNIKHAPYYDILS